MAERKKSHPHHGHAHEESTRQAHGHAHGGGEPSTNQQSPLEPGAARDKWIFFDAPSGLAGDMTIAALVDLGVPWQVVEGVVAALPIEGIVVEQSAVMRGAVGATYVRVSFPPEQPQRSYAEIRKLLEKLALGSRVVESSLRIFHCLALAEAEVHRIPVDEVRFHEVGAVDAIVDIVATAACLAYLEGTVWCSPLPIGGGSVMCQHGLLPLPAPATVNCLKGAPTYDAGVNGELVTPTGAAIVATVAEGFVRWPSFVLERVGWGAGTRPSFGDRPNALRVVLGTPSERQDATTTHTIVEASVDDMTGELAAHALSELMAQGALDAWATPVIMKKGRPGLVLSALARSSAAGHLADVLLRETSTIGVRFTEVSRHELPRRMVSVDTEYGAIPVKISGQGVLAEVKPEFSVCAEVARSHAVSVRVVLEAAYAAARSMKR